ncbi:MAG: holo-ACP synthase [Eubacteriales bacterium]
MIKGIGTDIVEVRRIKKLMENEHAVERILTQGEKEIFDKKPKSHEFLAGRFAAKEAVAKAFGVGISKCPLNEVEILPDEMGAPYVNLYGNAKALQDKMQVEKIFISISHEKEYAVATVVLEG